METNAQKESEINKVNVVLKNLGTTNKNKVVLNVNGKGRLTLYFSYESIISFELQTPDKYENKTIKNYWSVTTGKLLNECEPNKSLRLSEDNFKTTLTKAINLLF